MNELFKFMKRMEVEMMLYVNDCCFQLMIEARSCERFKVLSENITDETLAKYRDLMISEAGHYHLFRFCTKIC
jgi:tRNA-(ms[2]io[6]A)-hydroxylase